MSLCDWNDQQAEYPTMRQIEAYLESLGDMDQFDWQDIDDVTLWGHDIFEGEVS